jgi:hypothetical protein
MAAVGRQGRLRPCSIGARRHDLAPAPLKEPAHSASTGAEPAAAGPEPARGPARGTFPRRKRTSTYDDCDVTGRLAGGGGDSIDSRRRDDAGRKAATRSSLENAIAFLPVEASRSPRARLHDLGAITLFLQERRFYGSV